MELHETEVSRIEDDYKRLSYEHLSHYQWTTDRKIFDTVDLESINYRVSLTDGLIRIPSGFYLLQKNIPESNEKREPVRSKSKIQMMIQNKGEGEKIHMSIFDLNNDDKNLHRAWDIVARASINHGMTFIKVVKNEEREAFRTSSQCGKEISWYLVHNPVELRQIENYLTDITVGFVKAGIEPGPIAEDKRRESELEIPITGSNYFSIRSDDLNSKDADSLLKLIEIKVAHQPKRRMHERHIRTGSTYNTLFSQLESSDRKHETSPQDSRKNSAEVVENVSRSVRESSKEQGLKRITMNDEKIDNDPIDKVESHDDSNDDSDNSSGCCPC